MENGKHDFLLEIHKKVSEMHPVITVDMPRILSLLSTVSTAQTMMANAAASMADTNAKAEMRYERMERNLQAANDKASGKGQIPIASHYLTIGCMFLTTALIVLYVTKQNIDATLTSVKVKSSEEARRQ